MGQEFATIEAGKPFSITTGLAKLVQDKFTWCRNLRFLQQEKWLSAKMAFDGIDYYGSDEDANQSGIFLNFTQMKTMAAYSQIMSTMTGLMDFLGQLAPRPIQTWFDWVMKVSGSRKESLFTYRFANGNSESQYCL